MKIGIISDIHEDAERLSLALRLLEKNNCDRMICLGDISGYDDRFYSYRYSRNLQYCLDLIKVNCRDIIPGNHDLFHIKKLPSYNSIFHFPDNWYELTFAERKILSKGMIWLYEKDYPIKCHELLQEILNPCNDKIIIESDDLKLMFTHSIAPDISGFLTKKPVKVKDFEKHFELLNQNNCHIGLCGHSHPNGLLKISEKKVFNPKFSAMEISNKEKLQFIVPCIADGIQDNGVTILDTKEKTIEAIPIRTPKHNSFFL